MGDSPYENPQPDYTGIDFGSLSQIRRDAIKKWLPMVVPSAEGSPRFDNLMTHQKCVEQRNLNSNFTTCGSLPGWLYSKLGVHPKLANYGLAGVRDAAIELGCWRVNDELHRIMYQSAYGEERRPKPGDVYLFGSLRSDAEIMHIGVIVNPTGDQWWTADAGQGQKELQQALYVKRTWSYATRQLTGATYRGRTISGPFRLIGWVDLDRALEISR